MSKVAVSIAALLALGLAQGADAMTLYSTSSATCASVAVEGLRFSLGNSTACMTDGDSNPTANAINALDPTASDWDADRARFLGLQCHQRPPDDERELHWLAVR